MAVDDIDPELRVGRLPEFQVFDRGTLDAILDETMVAHVGVVRAGRPLVLPMACARDGDWLLLHGSTGGGMLRLASGTSVCVAVTHLDGLVFARSLFESSMHYRSAVILGEAEVLTGDARLVALKALSEHLFPGRSREVRDHSRKEVAATMVLRLSLARASVKVSDSPADDPNDGESREVWAGVVPLQLTGGAPRSADDVPSHVPTSPSALAAATRHHPDLNRREGRCRD